MGFWDDTWVGRASVRTFNALADAGDAIIEFAENPIENTGKALEKVEAARQWCVDKTATGLVIAGDFLSKGENWEMMAKEVGGFAWHAVRHPIRTQMMLSQGCLKGGASFIGIVVDAGAGAIRHGYRLGSEDGKPAWEWDEDHKGYSNSWRKWTGDVTDKYVLNPIMGEERSKYDKAWGYTGEAAFEIATFAGASVILPGAGGVLYASGRSALLAGKGVNVGLKAYRAGKGIGTAFQLASRASKATEILSTGARWGRGAGRAMSPLISRGRYAEELTHRAENMRRAAHKIETTRRGVLDRMIGRGTGLRATGENLIAHGKDGVQLAEIAIGPKNPVARFLSHIPVVNNYSGLAGKAARLESKAQYVNAATRLERIAGRAEHLRNFGTFGRPRAAVYEWTRTLAHNVNTRAISPLASAIADRTGITWARTALSNTANRLPGSRALNWRLPGPGTHTITPLELTAETAGFGAHVVFTAVQDAETELKENMTEEVINQTKETQQNNLEGRQNLLDRINGTEAPPEPSSNAPDQAPPPHLSSNFGESSSIVYEQRLAMSPYSSESVQSQLTSAFPAAADPYRFGQSVTGYAFTLHATESEWSWQNSAA